MATSENDVLLVTGIIQKSDALLIARLCTELQGLGGVRIEEIGGHAIFAERLPPHRSLQQVQAYCQGAMDAMSAAAGNLPSEAGNKPA